MRCPYFEDAYVGVCNASDFPCVPTIAEMEQYCFRNNYRSCRTFEASVSRKKVSAYHVRKAVKHCSAASPSVQET